MTQFKFKRHAAQYKNAKGDKTTISNGTMTDEKAIEFLRTNPARISLFAVYPSNWETILIDGVDNETAKEKEKRLAIEAEIAAAGEAAADKALNFPNKEGQEEAEETEAEKEARLAGEAAAEDSTKPLLEDLEKMTLKELRLQYPEIKATATKDFIEKVLALLN